MAVSETVDRAAWDAAARKLSSRAEALIDPTAAFSDTVFLDTLQAPHNQVIYGRRGTGKTHLLRRLADELAAGFDTHRTLPVFVNGSGLRHEAVVAADTPSAVALGLYVEFVRVLTSEIHELIDARIPVGKWDKLLGTQSAQKRSQAKAIVSELRDLIRNGEARFLPSGTASQEMTSVKDAAAGAGAQLGMKLTDPGNVGIKLDAHASANVKHTSELVRSVQGHVVLPLTAVTGRLKELLGFLDGASLVVLFDEWSDIAGDLDVQPYLAEMIKRTFSSITDMHVKLACVRGRTRLATPVSAGNPMAIGLEEGDDISPDVDLDRVVFSENDIGQFVPFFLSMLQRHMGLKLDWVRDMDAEAFGGFVVDDVFEGADTFVELCQAAAGTPRDFLQLFRNCTSMQSASPAPRILMLHIRSQAKLLFQAKRGSFAADSEELALLQRIYKDIVARHRTYLFLVSEEDAADRRLEALWSERLIHRMPVTHYDLDSNVTADYFQIDYGKCVDLLIADAIQKGMKQGVSMARQVPDGDFAPTPWLTIATDLLSSLLRPVHEGLREAMRAMRGPGGDLAPNPADIMLTRAILDGGTDGEAAP